MILELAKLSIKAEMAEKFVKVLPRAESIISQAKGFVSLEFKRSIENPNIFAALIHWETLEDHTVGFRESPLFLKWREVISPFFESKPEVEHFSVA